MHFFLQFSLSEKKNEKGTKTKWLNLFYDPYLGTEFFGTLSRFVIVSIMENLSIISHN